jgi:hypothetical protein
VAEPLEKRNLPAPYLSGGHIQLSLDAGNNIVSLRYIDSLHVRLTIDGTYTDYGRTDLESIYVAAGDGDDRIVIAPDVDIIAAIDGGDGTIRSWVVLPATICGAVWAMTRSLAVTAVIG